MFSFFILLMRKVLTHLGLFFRSPLVRSTLAVHNRLAANHGPLDKRTVLFNSPGPSNTSVAGPNETVGTNETSGTHFFIYQFIQWVSLWILKRNPANIQKVCNLVTFSHFGTGNTRSGRRNPGLIQWAARNCDGANEHAWPAGARPTPA